MPLFAIQVKSRAEERFVKLLGVNLPGVVLHFLKRKLSIRRAGKSIDELSPVFPGYVFLEADDFPASALVAARSTGLMYKFLPSNDDIQPLSERDRQLLSHFLRLGKVVGPSLAEFDAEDRICIVEGPLVGLEGNIVSVNKRKRRAKLRLDLCGDSFYVDLGYELLVKRNGVSCKSGD